MASRHLGFEGGISRWVGPAEIEIIAAGLAECGTAEAVARWARDYPAGPLYSGVDGGFVGLDVMVWFREWPLPEVSVMVVSAVSELASRRRHRAIVEWATGRRSVPMALITVARCPTCRTSVDVRTAEGIYCRDHRDDEVAEIGRLVSSTLL